MLVPSMFIAHEPQMPSRHERRNVNVLSISPLILMRASRTMGPQVVRSTQYVSVRGLFGSSGFQRYILNCFQSPFAPLSGLFHVLPVEIVELRGRVSWTMEAFFRKMQNSGLFATHSRHLVGACQRAYALGCRDCGKLSGTMAWMRQGGMFSVRGP